MFASIFDDACDGWQDGVMLDRLIFVTGLRKSGTSMVKNLLDGHFC